MQIAVMHFDKFFWSAVILFSKDFVKIGKVIEAAHIAYIQYLIFSLQK